ncbi:AMP-binding protein [Nocardioides sp. Kera G14]|uniref:AMP-binding protein n=1 Tax=Nocardioides sp. Kera G14 TaxID=2884264 RepID=UPI001D11FE2A|nr:AMP-binding protein [Nocardioides sp. Kera G14]UDY22250.1 AMP-binding protein [Nocardioides sp. Kera G14]
MTQDTRPLNLADVLEAMADAVPDRTAVFTMARPYTFAELDERATRFANHLVSEGIQPGEHVAVHSRNRIEWVEAYYGCFKARAVPININFKYLHDELTYLYDNADIVATIVAPEHVEAVKGLVVPGLRHVLVMGEEYEAAMAAASTDRELGGRAAGRTGDDHYVLFTGGTTGRPKGVVWRNEDIIPAAMNEVRFKAPIESVEKLAEEAIALETPMTILACGPMMHGGSQWILGNGHLGGHTVALYTEPSFSAETLLDLVQAAGVVSLTFLGDAMGRPVADALEAEPDRWDLSKLVAMSNGSAPLSDGVRAQLRKVLPGRFILDTVGASESGATAKRIDDGQDAGAGAPRFDPDPDAAVLRADGTLAEVGEEGLLARTGPLPLGYYKDPEKTAATFKEYDGKRWTIPGDAARLEADGSISLLGRGSVCINTGGEKVHPEEVEAALLRHDDIFDAVAVGVPHPRWGQQVVALVQAREGHDLTADDVRAHCRALIANYKVPKEIIFVDRVPRTPVSKVDYPASRALATGLLDTP